MGFLDRLTAAITGEEVTPDDVRDDLELARAYFEHGDLATARTRLIALSAAHPRVAPVFVMLGQVQLHEGDAAAAVASFGRALDVSPRAVAAWLGLGQAQVLADRRDQALHAFRRVVALTDVRDPARAHACAGRGEIALRDGAPARALRELRRAHEILPDDPAIVAALGRALLATGVREGERYLLHAARAPDATPQLVLEAARALSDPAAATELLRARLRTMADDDARVAELRALLSQCLLAAHEVVEAGAVARAGLVAHPDHPELLAAASAALSAEGHHVEALALAEKRRRLAGEGDLAALVGLALATHDREALARVLEGADPQDPRVQACKSFVAGLAGEAEVRLLLGLAPDEATRQHVARALAPPLPSEADLVALLRAFHELCSRPGPLSGLAPRAARALEGYDRPLLVAVMGEFNAGKSSLVNALCGRDLAPVGVTPTTATINVLRHGEPGGRVVYQDGNVRKLPAKAVAPFLQSLVGQDAGAIRAVEVFMPVPFLEHVEIVDTPGLNAARAEHEALSRGYLVEADALVWVFAAGQAAKASEKDALLAAHTAGKPVIGVVNKADHLDAEELPAVLDYVRGSFGDCLTDVIAVSARRALEQGDGDALAPLRTQLERHLLANERALKRATALTLLQALMDEAEQALVAAEPDDDHGARAAALRALSDRVAGALARERLQFPERMVRGFDDAGDDAAEIVRPMRLLDGLVEDGGERETDFMADLLEDVSERAVAVTVAALCRALLPDGDSDPVDGTLRARLHDAAAAAGARYSAFARGSFRGGVAARVLRRLQGTGKPDRQTLARELAAAAPDPERELFAPFASAADALLASARGTVAESQRATVIERALFEARHRRPLDVLARTLATLKKTDGRDNT